MERYFDKIFEKLHNIQKPDLWYKARIYVQSNGTLCEKSGCTNVVFDKLTEETLAVARQIALVAHPINFNENTGKNRSVITFYDCKSFGINSVQDVKSKMKSWFGNLFDYCQYSFDGGVPMNKDIQDNKNNNWLPLDIEFHFYKGEPKEEIKKVILAAKVKTSFDKYPQTTTGIDITKGMLVNMVYTTGVSIDNLPACDNDNVARYDIALKVYCYKLKTEHVKEIWDETAKKGQNGEYNEVDIKNQLSSIFCADCFESRLKSILDTSNKSLREYLLHDFETVMKKVNENIKALAYCEHNRWNVEKLIMGFSPLDIKERYQLECIFGQERKDKIKSLKKEFKHIDLCSNRDLRRVNPADVKYDYFLMLAMPQILLSSMK